MSGTPAPVGEVPPLPPADPGLRLSLLLGFHAELCLRSSGGPERHRPPGGSENRLPAACWRALAVVDASVGDLDEGNQLEAW